mmetsp:Transcript_123989/g.219699  ORF Transcript_123989/g.219699 Transcript_123989/m.219699 type:complete len:95 (-) Transcript_123989:31-315(-)
MGVLALRYPSDDEECGQDEEDGAEDKLANLDKWFGWSFLIICVLMHVIVGTLSYGLHRQGKDRRNPRLELLKGLDIVEATPLTATGSGQLKLMT